MRKDEIETYCKKIGAKRESSRTMANHNKTIYYKDFKRLIVDSSPYSENVWDVNFISFAGSCTHVPSFERLVAVFY